jgi:hypothetical protein
MRTTAWTILIGLLFLALAVAILGPVPIPEEKDCLIVKGTVVDLYEAGTKDVVFKLKGDDRIFYVNRGLENGLDLKKLKSELINKEITIKYPKHWTPLDPFNSVRHISKIESGGQTIFSEID